METMGEGVFSWNDPTNKRIRELEKKTELLSKGIRRQKTIVKKEISLGKKEIVRSYIFQGLKASSFSNIWDNKTSILLSKEKTKQGRVCSINTFYTDSYGQKRKFPMILLQETSSPGFRHRLWLSKNENCITNQGL
jgi:hypothetical protein